MAVHHKHYNSYTGYWYRKEIHHKILMITHKCIYGQAPVYLKNLIEIRGIHNRNMHSNENGLLLRSPYIKHQTFASHSFKYAAPALWNGLPLHIREIEDLTAFKCQFKTHLDRKAFSHNTKSITNTSLHSIIVKHSRKHYNK